MPAFPGGNPKRPRPVGRPPGPAPVATAGTRGQVLDLCRHMPAVYTILQGDRDAAFTCAAMHTSAPGAGALTHWPSVARGLASSKRRLRQVASLPPRRWPAVRHSPPPSIHGGDDPNGTYLTIYAGSRTPKRYWVV